ncbi:MAG TPA: LacI family DNA-binding transcriptional regulator [Dermatophilaceae bacterium]|nr:LacI family DNA-binding transcriptional regulator [Dermatophilaceae bacterium]
MKDVASAAGVSKALVSIVFRGAPGASEATREHVFKVAADLGYRANRTASLLKLRRTKHLGVTMQVRSSFHAELVEAIQEAADDAGYKIVLSTVTPTHDEQRAVETLLEFRCESLILLGSGLPGPSLDALARTLPVVLVGRRAGLATLDVVRSADDVGQQRAVDHLVQQGHTRIAHVDGGRGVISADRRRGYRTAMRRHRLGPQAVILPGGPTEQDGWQAAGELLGLDPVPTAVTAFNDQCALGVISRLSTVGWSVPADFSVTGYDDAPFARLATVDLTTVSQDAAAQSRRAVRAAVERLEGLREQPDETVLMPRLVVRGTTGPAPTSARGARAR